MGKESNTLQFTRALIGNCRNVRGLGKSRGPVRGVLYVPRLNFKRFHVAISEGSHVAVGISSTATDIDLDKFFCCDRTCIHQYSSHMQNEYPTSLKVQRQQCSASLAVVHGH